MNPTAPATSAPTPRARPIESTRSLLRDLLWLSIPVLAENLLHMLVGLNDTYLANHVGASVTASGASLEAERAAAAAAVGAITYIL